MSTPKTLRTVTETETVTETAANEQLVELLSSDYLKYVRMACIDAEKKTLQIAFLPGTPESILALYGVKPGRLN